MRERRPWAGPGVAIMGLFGAMSAACATATPDEQIRLETDDSQVAQSLCARMASDFDMALRDDEEGPFYQAHFASRALDAGGAVTFTLGVDDGTGAQNCVNSAGGTVCAVSGPAEVRVQTLAGVAQYQVRAGERARVSTLRATLRCRPMSELSAAPDEQAALTGRQA